MSLAPQRPNYVLVWIGIIMLTFSMVGQWFLAPGSNSPADFVGSTRSSLDFEDSANLPIPQNLAGNTSPLRALVAEDSFDQMVPLHGEEISFDEISFANQEDFLGPDTIHLFPKEAVDFNTEPAKSPESGELSQGLIPEIPSVEDMPEQLHSFRNLPLQESNLSRKQKAKRRYQDNNQGQGNYNSSFENRGLGRSSEQRTQSDRIVLVKTKIISSGGGKVAVSFLLNHPKASGQFLDRLQKLDGEDSKLAQMAETYLAAMEEVIREDASDQADYDSKLHAKKKLALKRLAQMKAKVRENLRQRPGGIELLAELSPSQLEALLQKLSAQNPKFRALVNS